MARGNPAARAAWLALGLLLCAGRALAVPATVFKGPGADDLSTPSGRFQRTMPLGAAAAAPTCTPASEEQTLEATPETVNWGYYYNGLAPAISVENGSTVNMELISHEAGNAYDLMVEGDPNVEAIYNTSQVSMRGASGNGDGVHILTGPVYVCGAQPGDVLQLDILDLQPRANPATGRTYGSNTAASWGWHYTAGFLDGDTREVITIYEVIKDADGKALYLVPDHSWRYANAKEGYYAAVAECTPVEGEVPNTTPEGEAMWENYNRTYTKGVGNVPCVNGKQTWPKAAMPGTVATQKRINYSVRGKWRAPANLHIGNLGIAPAVAVAVTSIPPTSSIGGNIDNRRLGVGSTVYYPVQVAGALFSAGDAHASMGDSELDGTGVETSINAKLKFTVHSGSNLPAFLQGLNYIVAENADSYIVHGFTYNDYLSELGPTGQTDIFGRIPSGGKLDRAMTVAYNNTRDFSMRAFNLTEDEAISALTLCADFIVTQVVDGSLGVHAVLAKYCFQPNDGKPWLPTIATGTSKPLADLQAAYEAAPAVQPNYLNGPAPGPTVAAASVGK